MTLMEYALLAFVSLFVIIDPLSTVPAFLAMTPRDTPGQKVRMALIACVISALVLAGFALVGQWLFRFLGITLEAFQIAGGIVLLFVALDMLQARRSAVMETPEETREGQKVEDIAVCPLAIPMLAGPGAITTAILLENRAADFWQHMVLYGVIAAVCALSYVMFYGAAQGTRWLSPLAMKVTTRLMGLLLAAIAVQFVVGALQSLFPGIVRVP
ncbi:MAG: MarC family protein [Verrucomicrobiae bacterium]|nr:MarC family protein [Verrucomicrobiae bacterium]